MFYGENECQACGKPIQQQPGGHRQRKYCNDACRQRARRELFDARVRGLQEQREIDDGRALGSRWRRFSAETRDLLNRMKQEHGLRVAYALTDAMETEIYRALKRDLKKLT